MYGLLSPGTKRGESVSLVRVRILVVLESLQGLVFILRLWTAQPSHQPLS